MLSLRVMVKRSRGKWQQEETEKQQYVIVQKKMYLKVLLQKVFEITTESCPASLTATVDGAAVLPTRNHPQREEFHAMSLSSLPDYFWS